MKREKIILEDRTGKVATYIEQPKTKYKKLKEFAGRTQQEFSGERYYWVIEMTGNGSWYRGGFYISPFIHNHVNVFYDRYTDQVFKQTDVHVFVY